MSICILKAATADAVEILELQKLAYQSEAELYNDWSIPPLTQTLSQITAEFDAIAFFKAMESGRIVGSARVLLKNDSCLIGRVIVHPEFQRKGIGTQLMVKMEAEFPNAGRFELFTGRESVGNIRFYQQLGYKIFREEDLTPKVRLVFMEKRRERLAE